MQKHNQKWFSGSGLITVWSHGSTELIPERFKRIITIVLPLVYFQFFVAGVFATFIPLPVFSTLVGDNAASSWAMLVGLTSLISFLGLVYRIRIEIYSNIILSTLLAIYPIFLIVTTMFPNENILYGHLYTFLDFSVNSNAGKISLIFLSSIFPMLPIWRAFDIVLEIRKNRKRQLFAEAALGEE